MDWVVVPQLVVGVKPSRLRGTEREREKRKRNDFAARVEVLRVPPAQTDPESEGRNTEILRRRRHVKGSPEFKNGGGELDAAAAGGGAVSK